MPIGDGAAEALAAHLAALPAKEVEVLDTGRRPVTRSARLSFLDDRGRPLHRGSSNELIWSPARTAAGIPKRGCTT